MAANRGDLAIALLRRFGDPDDLGYAVTDEVRRLAREVLGPREEQRLYWEEINRKPPERPGYTICMCSVRGAPAASKKACLLSCPYHP